MNWIILIAGVMNFALAGFIFLNERDARRGQVAPTIVMANSFAAAVNVLLGVILSAISVPQLISG